uniref:Uncharacterized protein n=1 Tax=uncultured Bacillota bacterium TaxID=344338 RepID=A0A650EN04_9FIRM|nr:hypothetical protein Firmicute1046_2060 [uncultured Firmicutes bacterium]
MRNYEAIMKMTILQLEAFLDGVYCTGLNTGLYAARLEDVESYDILDENPFSVEWLTAEAEPAVLTSNRDSEDKECLNALTKAVLRNANIEYDENDDL